MSIPPAPPALKIVSGTARDVPVILSLIRALAEYERLSDACVATEDALRATLFGPRAAAEVVIGYAGDEPVGFAIFFQNYSTFLAKPGLYLEDLFVKPEWRRHGYGKALLAHLAAIAVERGYGRMEWSVLDWNAPSIAFYKSLRAEPMDEWTTMRLTGAALRALSESANPKARIP
jgi:GNAT superfamily N-acetyltransferase